MKKYIPNSITLLNLACGCAAIVSVLYGQFNYAFWLFMAGVFADYFDGFIARILKVSSELGKELDSLADMVTFGVFPGAVLYILLVKGNSPDFEPEGIVWSALPGFLVSVFSGLRLGKFNIDTRQSENFIGLPTPSSTTFAVGIMLIYYFDSFGLRDFVAQDWFLYTCSVLLSVLLISEIPMFSFKFKGFQWKGNEIKFIFAAVAIISLVILREAAFSFVILLYVVINTITFLFNRKSST